MSAVVTVNDVLDGRVVLDVECLDRIYFNDYVPNLQVGGRVASFMTAHPLRPLLAADQPPAPPPVRKALRTIDIHISERIDETRLLPKVV